MDKKQISQVVDAWIAEEELPVSATVKPVRKYDLYQGMDEQDIEAYWDFIRWYLSQEHLLLQVMPAQEEPDFYAVELDELGNNVSAFNTYDFQKLNPFDRYHWKVKKICEQVRELAITHSCISDADGKRKVREKYLNLARNNCKDSMTFFKVWREYAYWE